MSARMNRLVVVGNGMAGVACVEQILKHAPRFDVTIFGDETHVNYNRILLSSVLAGEKTSDDIALNPIEWYERNNIQLRVGTRVTDVDPVAKTVTSQDGAVTPFDTLLLATGSSAWMPPIEGLDKDGVFAFRTLDDTRALLGRARAGARAVVIGGGLLGLEAARGLQVQGCDVTVVHLMNTLMERQLDPTGGGYLTARMEALGIRVLLGRSTKAIRGGAAAEAVEFADGTCIDAELIVVAAGIRPNVELGRKAGLQVNRGIVVNDHLETSQPRHLRGRRMRGAQRHLLRPDRAAHRAGKGAGGDDHGQQGPDVQRERAGVQAQDHGRRRLLRRRVGGCAMGPSRSASRIPDEGVYKKLVVRDGKLAGVILVGDTSDSAPLHGVAALRLPT